MKYGWTLSEQRWRQLNNDVARLAPDGDWRKTKLDPVFLNSVPTDAGVYVICARPPVPGRIQQALYSPVYVGKARVLRQRFYAHCHEPSPPLAEAKRCFDYNLDYWYLPAPEGAVGELESILIDCLGPPANRQRGIIAIVGKPEPA